MFAGVAGARLIIMYARRVDAGRKAAARAARPTESTMSDQVLVADDGGVRTIRLNRPEKKNALTQPMYEVMTRSPARGSGERGHPRHRAGRGARRVLRRRRHRRVSRSRAERRIAAEDRRVPARAGAQSEAPRGRGRRRLRSASAPRCCCIAITSLPRPTPHLSRRSRDSASSPKPHRACWRRCAWATRAPSRCSPWAGRCRLRPPRSRHRQRGGRSRRRR